MPERADAMPRLRSRRFSGTPRERVVLLCFLLWALIIVGRLAQVTVLERQALLDEMAREAVARDRPPAGETRPDALPTLAQVPDRAY